MRILLPCLLVAASTTAFAQNFNIDVGNQPTFSPLPAATYGAGAGQAGTWNGVDGTTAGPFALVDITGAATAVTVSRTGPSSIFAVDNASTSGNDAALMDDGYDPGTATPWSTWTFSGLSDGNYRLFTYAWAPDSSAYLSRVSVAGSTDGNVAVGGWPSPFAHVQSTTDYPPAPPPTTYCVHHVRVAGGGTIAVTISNALTFGTLNGFQIVKDGDFVGFCVPGLQGTIACACGNPNGAGVGCANTGSTGASLAAAGSASLAADATDPGSVVLTGSSMFSGSSGIMLQGPNGSANALFGAGVRCAGGQLFRLKVVGITGGAASYPVGADRSISNRSSDLGTPITPGSSRFYQCYYRDPNLINPGGSCPPNATFNISSGQIIYWRP